MPSQEDLSRYYTTFWNTEDTIVSSSTKRYFMAQSISRIRYINQHATIKENSAVLDVGAGLGMFAEALIKEGFKCQYNAIEPDKLQRSNLAKNKTIKNTYAKIEDVTGGDRFDLIILSECIKKHGNVRHLCSVGSEISTLKEKKHISKRNFCLNNIKELIKLILILLDKNHINKQINKLQMSVSGKNRRWLRAIIQK